MSDWPKNPNIGDLHTNASGMTFEFTAKGTWRGVGRSGASRFTIGDTSPLRPEAGDYWHDTSADVLKIFDRTETGERWVAVSGTAVGATAPSNPVESMMWYNTVESNLYRYVLISGQGKWQLLASSIIASSQIITSRVLPLTWLYDDERFNFELFVDDANFNFRNITPRLVLDGVAADDSLEVEYVDDISTGQNYILYSKNLGLLDVVRVNSRLSAKRLKLQAILTKNYGASGTIKDAYLSRTSFSIQDDGTAIVRDDDIFFTRPLNALESWPNGEFAIRRSAQGTGEFIVDYKYPDATVWFRADLLQTRSVEGGIWRDEIYEIPTTGIVEFRIQFSAAANVTETLQHMVLYGAPQNNDTNRIEKPNNVSPADGASGVSATPVLTGSTYRSIFGLAQAGAHFQVAEDQNFSSIVVNTSSDYLSSWVSVSGQSANFTDVVAYDNRKFLMVGAGGVAKLTEDGGKTVTNLNTGISGNLNSVAFNDIDLIFAVGAGGAGIVTQNNGASWSTLNFAGGYGGSLNGVAAKDAFVLAVGNNAEIQRSTNNGSIFSKITPPNSYAGNYMDVSMDSLGRAVIVGTSGEIDGSNNFGQTWVKRTPASAYAGTFNSVSIDPEGSGLAVAVGDNGEVQRTEDAGALWQKIVLPGAYAGKLRRVDVRGTNVVIVGDGGKIFTSEDSGVSFVLRPSGSGITNNLYGVALDESLYGVIVGISGALEYTLRLEGEFGTTYTVPAGTDMLTENKVYWWRVRYQDSVGYWSPWSTPTAFATMTDFNYVVQPQNLAPANGAVSIPLQATLQSSSFQYVGSADTHQASIWQVASDQGFGNVLYNSGERSAANEKTQFTLPANIGLVDQGTYFWRVRHKGSSGELSPWSVPTSFKTQVAPNAPSILEPANNATGQSPTLTIKTSSFSTTTVGETQIKSQYQVSRNDVFTDIAYDSGESNDLTQHKIPTANALVAGQDYWIRARHKGLNTGFSPWSVAIKVNVTKPGKPSLTAPASGANNVSLRPNATSSAFSSTASGDEHTSSQWQFSSNPGFTAIIHDSGETTTAKTAYSYPSGVTALSPLTTYYARVRHKGTLTGWSDWSDSNSFGTAAPSGNQELTTTGTFSVVIPDGITAISVLAVGAGFNASSTGGGGGAVGYKNNITVTPGETLTATIPATGSRTPTTLRRGSTTLISIASADGRIGGTSPTGVDGGGAGGNGGDGYSSYGGGGGAAGRIGYTGGDGSGYTSQSIPSTTYTLQSQLTSDTQYNSSTYQGETWSSGDVYGTNGAGSTYSQTYLINVSNSQMPGHPYWTYRIMTYSWVNVASTTYSTVYSSTNPTGTSGLGRGGTAGARGEGIGLTGSNSAPSGSLGYGYGGGTSSTTGGNGAMRIVWGQGVSFPNNAG